MGGQVKPTAVRFRSWNNPGGFKLQRNTIPSNPLPGLVPGIHVFVGAGAALEKSWTAGSSPAEGLLVVSMPNLQPNFGNRIAVGQARPKVFSRKLPPACRCCARLSARPGAFEIERQQPRQGILLADIGGPPIGRRDRRIEVAMRIVEPGWPLLNVLLAGSSSTTVAITQIVDNR